MQDLTGLPSACAATAVGAVFLAAAAGTSAVWPVLFAGAFAFAGRLLQLERGTVKLDRLRAQALADEAELELQRRRRTNLEKQLEAAERCLADLEESCALHEVCTVSQGCRHLASLVVAAAEERELNQLCNALRLCVEWSQTGEWQDYSGPLGNTPEGTIVEEDEEQLQDAEAWRFRRPQDFPDGAGRGLSSMALFVQDVAMDANAGQLVAAHGAGHGQTAGLVRFVPNYAGPIIEMEEVMQECTGPLGPDALASALEGMQGVVEESLVSLKGAVASFMGR
ncbi:unnamed protein product [Polarella glacialis]|uniref:Uncharacterized protein n=1 Tax=Polarella glacialis TaxID=89957 RepID=A0A813HHF2_POLGL|nr:unnamed protein product [Polarella glacialis]